MKDLNLAIVDVETTGHSPTKDRIIEIGILVIEKGRLVEKFSSLVNPERPFSPFITGLTGISSEDLNNAPTFDQIQEKIGALLKGRIFVAHNARFDYHFIQEEFRRLDFSFSARLLCTVKLSRKLYASEKRHGLDGLIERFGFACASRHRAFDDARVLWDFLQHVQQDVPEDQLNKALKQVLKLPTLPPQLSPQALDRVPAATGVYIFYNPSGVPLYVGKSVNVRDRILSHFSDASEREAEMVQQTADIETVATSSELGALLLESHLVKRLRPVYNRRLRVTRKLIILKRKRFAGNLYETVEMEILNTLTPEDVPNLLGIFKSIKKAKEFLYEKAERHGLCPRFLGLEKGSGRCFSAQLKKCRGACAGEDKPLAYNLRFNQAFEQSRLRRWPYPGPVVIEEIGENQSEAFLVDQWCLIGSLKADNWDTYDFKSESNVFDYDAYKILVRWLLKPKRNVRVRALEKNPAESAISNFF